MHRCSSPSAAARLMLGWALALLVAGCLPDFDNPLSPVEQGIEAPELLGLWAMAGEDATLYVHVLRGPGNRLEITAVSHEDDGGGSVDLYDAHVTAAAMAPGGPARFANFRRAADTGPDDAPEGPFGLVGYSVESDVLTISFPSPERLAEAVEAGRLAGTATTDSLGTSVHLTGSGAEILAFLEAADPAALFDRSLTFVRVPPSPGP